MTRRTWPALAAAAVLAAAPALWAADRELIPPQLSRAQQENLLRFLQRHEKPDRFIPPDAKVVSSGPGNVAVNVQTPPGQAIKQYTVQIALHRPVPGQEQVRQVDVYY